MDKNNTHILILAVFQLGECHNGDQSSLLHYEVMQKLTQTLFINFTLIENYLNIIITWDESALSVDCNTGTL